jgi:POT family proton-dependent oligopeptide transporter
VEVTKHQHPPALHVFFATEMWERYGFYVVQTLLALYLSLFFSWPDKRIYALIGSFTALTYISPVLGGWIADHLIGQKRATLLGAFVLLFSYLFLSLYASDYSLPYALAGMAVGTGLLKSNISSLLGNQYPEHSASRERGFTIFYMGITSGIILGTTLPSYLSRHFGWSVSFMSAAIGISLGIIIFSFGIKYYRIRDYKPYQYSAKRTLQALCMILFLWGISVLIMRLPSLADSVFIAVTAFSLGYLLYCVRQEESSQGRKTLVILLLCVISAMFWAFYFQMFLSLTLFISRIIQPNLFGIPFPPPSYVAIQSVGMIVIGLFLSRKKIDAYAFQNTIRAGNKFLLSMFVMTCAYALIVFVAHISTQQQGLLSPLWIIPAYLMISLAELLLSPVGLCAITVLANRNRVSTMMGIFFVSLGIGGFLSGKFAAITAMPSGDISLLMLKQHYEGSFIIILKILASFTVLCIGLNALIKRLMNSCLIPQDTSL